MEMGRLAAKDHNHLVVVAHNHKEGAHKDLVMLLGQEELHKQTVVAHNQEQEHHAVVAARKTELGRVDRTQCPRVVVANTQQDADIKVDTPLGKDTLVEVAHHIPAGADLGLLQKVSLVKAVAPIHVYWASTTLTSSLIFMLVARWFLVWQLG